MSCCNSIAPVFSGCQSSMNQKVSSILMELPDGIRKEFRLLTKQYEILEAHVETPTMCGKYMTNDAKIIVRYKPFGESDDVFEWIIDDVRMQFNLE